MKIRISFVSNSSSSSYIIALNKTFEEDPYKVRNEIMQFFHIDPESTFWDIAKDIAEYFLVDNFHYTTVEELEENYFLRPIIKRKMGFFKHFYHGEIDNFDGGLGEFILDNIAINIDNKDMYMFFDGMF